METEVEVSPIACTLMKNRLGAVHAEIEHLLKESNIRNPGYFVFANTSMFLCWKHYMFMGRKCLRKQNNLDFICYFHSINVQFLR